MILVVFSRRLEKILPAAMPADKLQFASDNYSGFCPEALAALQEANRGHAYAYGDDRWTEEACNLIRDIFETDCEVFFVFTGTAANALALASLCQPYHSVICPATAHIETDECGGPEFFSGGSKILIGRSENGKLLPESIGELVNRRTDIHYPKPKAVSISQTTELGGVYTPEELGKIQDMAARHRLKIHMDGARFANAAAALGAPPKEISWRRGVDALSFGGTKNGAPGGEAVVFFNKALAEDFAYRCKQAGQLASKMRFITAPWRGLLRGGVWLRNAARANALAKLLEEELRKIPGVKLLFPRQANAVFIELPPPAAQKLRDKGWHFYTFIGAGGTRLMCSWDTREDAIREIIKDIKKVTAEA